MFAGHVDEFGRAVISVSLRATPEATPVNLDVWIDTGFTGELVLPEKLVTQLALSQSAMVTAGLADGSQSLLATFSCEVDWFGEFRTIEAIANQGQFPLLGVGLLLGHRLAVDYNALTLSIE